MRIGPGNKTMTPPIISATRATAEMACAAEREAFSRFPLPVYCATMTVPPVASAINTLSRKTFSESTIPTALTAAVPAELIMAVFNRLRQAINA